MTTKQIAEYLGKPERTVRDWVKALAAKSAVVAAKLAASSPAKPADWDLAETCQIIAEGMGEDVAAVYRTNAANAEMKSRAAKPPRLPAGIQLREIRLLAEKGHLTRDDVRRLLGLTPAPQAPALPSPEERASDAVGEAAFASIQAAIGAKGARQIAGAVGRIVGDAVARKEADRKQGRLL